MQDALNARILEVWEGKVVRKDLTSRIRANMVVPTFVSEYLLAQYCATHDPVQIENGLKNVQKIIQEHFVHRENSEFIKFQIREKGSHKIIDRVAAYLNEREDRYEAQLINLNIKEVPIADGIVRQHPKLLRGGVWAMIKVLHIPKTGERPWAIDELRPIQFSNIDLEEYRRQRSLMAREEWIDLLIQTMGLNPAELSERTKLLYLCRLAPFCEYNYNFLELGPKGTGKSHIFSELSPHCNLVSGGEVTRAKLFIDNRNGEIGLVGYWDVIAFDEFARGNIDGGLLDIMKNYMANYNFARGAEAHSATASFAFLGNIRQTVSYMLRNSHLFASLSGGYQDSAFLDRLHCYLPGWEIPRLRSQLFTQGYGFVVDYFAEALKALRAYDYSQYYAKFFTLDSALSVRDKTAIEKTLSAFIKIIHPDGNPTEREVEMLLNLTMENRLRIRLQLPKIDRTFEPIPFIYFSNRSSNHAHIVTTLEAESYLNQAAEEEAQTPSDLPQDLPPAPLRLKEGERRLRDGQVNISFEALFGDYLQGADRIRLLDPYIRHPWQIRNLIELLIVVYRRKKDDTRIYFELITNNDQEYIELSKENFNKLQQNLEPLDIEFTFCFDSVLHDRQIELNNGWLIKLGRGLDIFQRTEGLLDLADRYQPLRKCKECTITYLRQTMVFPK
jgi:ATP-dependent Lon protease